MKASSVALATLLLAGCTGTGSSSSQSASTAENAAAETDGEYPVLRMPYRVGMFGNSDEELVEEEINKILREKAQAEIDLVGIEIGNWTTQLNLMLTGGENSLDIFTSYWYTSVSNLQSNGQVIALDDLMSEEAPELQELFADYPEILDCARINGQLYGIPAVTAWASGNIYVVNKNDSDAANIDWTQVHSLEDLTDAMIKMKQANPSSYYIPGSTEPYWVPKDIDYLGDTYYLGVLTDPMNSTTIENYYESDYFKNFLENVKVWKENGLISPDPLSNSNPTLSNLQYGIANGTPGYSWSVDEFCYEMKEAGQFSFEMVGCDLGDRMLTTGNVTTSIWCITPFCKDPAAAMRVMNELFTNPEVANLLANGIEGRHYVMNENGQMQYPEGTDTSALGWNSQSGSYFPNSMLCPAWDFQQPDVYDQMKQSNEESPRSLALGFSFDSSSVTDQITACTNVIAQYYTPLMYAEVDIDEVLPVFQQALRDAGIDEIIAEKQKQLDAWLAEQ